MLPRPRRALGATVLAATLALTLAPVDALASQQDDGTIVGADGVTYPRAPRVVMGRDADRFDGYTFDIVCSDGAAGLKRSIKRLARTVRLIEESGRRVVWTVLPPKAEVNTDDVVRGQLPHGACDRRGLDQQRKLLDTYPDRSFLHARAPLAKDPRDLFWRTDPHWTTTGASVFTKLLATTLDPVIGRLQKYTRGEDQSGVGALSDGPTETVESRVPASAVTVTDLPGTTPIDASTYVLRHDWRSSPAKLTYPGRTLVLGDSFGFIALANLRPIFARGQWLWADNPDKVMAKAVAQADTVVIEVAHLFASVSPLATRSFRTAVRKALKKH